MPNSRKTPPKPLAAMPPAKLDWSRPETPVSTQFDDIYFSVDDGLKETRNVFLKACNLPEAWAGRVVFTVGELGFGSGLNFLALWQLWRERRPSPNAQLHFVSVEGFPLSKEQLEQALKPWAELSDLAAELITKWPGRVPGHYRVELSDGVTLTLCHDEVLPALENMDMQADSWFLDGFSPAKNPDMWSADVLQHIFDLSAPGARVGTFTVAGLVRRGLSEAGFDVTKREGFGRKRERLEAIKPGQCVPATVPETPPIIIGGGIAGASLARAFLRRGITPVIIDPHDDSAASGNPAAIVKPRLDLQDRAESRLFLSSYLYALSAYEDVNDAEAIIQRGVAHAAKTDKEVLRYEKLIAQAPLSEDHMKRLQAEDMKGLTGIDTPLGGVWFGSGLIIRPKRVLTAWTYGADVIKAKAARIENNAEGWSVYDEHGTCLAQSSQIYLTTGAAIQTLIPNEALDVRYLRGQVSWGAAPAQNALKSGLVYGGYALNLGSDILLGATHTKETLENPLDIFGADDRQNIDAFIAMGGFEIDPTGARASVRVTTPKTLPLIGELKPGLSVITGLGGRGFVFAPLLGEQLAAEYTQTPHPIAKDAALRLSIKSEP